MVQVIQGHSHPGSQTVRVVRFKLFQIKCHPSSRSSKDKVNQGQSTPRSRSSKVKFNRDEDSPRSRSGTRSYLIKVIQGQGDLKSSKFKISLRSRSSRFKIRARLSLVKIMHGQSYPISRSSMVKVIPGHYHTNLFHPTNKII